MTDNGGTMTKDLADELERLAFQEGFSVVDVDVFVQKNLPAILSALRGEQWQGIETAPREPVLLYFPPVWNERRREWTHTEMLQIGHAGGSPYRPPTHWMPLPPPPKGTE